MRQALLILLVSAAFVLLVGCVNVANLQLAQAAGRQHEIALRVALGASTWTVARQLLVEGVLLAVIGGLAGVAIAAAGVPALLALSPVHVPYAEGIAVNWRVFAFALALSLVTGLATGLLPAVLTARTWTACSGPGLTARSATRAVGRGAPSWPAKWPSRSCWSSARSSW